MLEGYQEKLVVRRQVGTGKVLFKKACWFSGTIRIPEFRLGQCAWNEGQSGDRHPALCPASSVPEHGNFPRVTESRSSRTRKMQIFEPPSQAKRNISFQAPKETQMSLDVARTAKRFALPETVTSSLSGHRGETTSLVLLGGQRRGF